VVVTFQMVLPIRVVSINNRTRPGKLKKAAFIERMRVEAASHFQGHQMLKGRLYARIIWLHDHQQGDLDNITKAILDALTMVVYPDDRAIVKCLVESIDLSDEDLDLAGEDRARSDLPTPILDELLALVGENHQQILYVEVGEVQSQQLVFGPIR
jgi:Holliday junction resolvase RusA-like endonuclease